MYMLSCSIFIAEFEQVFLHMEKKPVKSVNPSVPGVH